MEINFKIITKDTCDILILDVTLYQEESNKTDFILAAALENLIDESEFSKLGDEEGLFNFNVKDGYYKATLLLIPTEEYFKSHPIDSSIINYYSDGLKVYKYYLKETTEVPLEEVVQVYNSNVKRSFLNFLTFCKLKKCYISYCKKDIINLNKCSKHKLTSFNKDLLWMTLNIVDYLLSFNQDEEAGKLLTLINDCNGICKSEYLESNKNECGCA